MIELQMKYFQYLSALFRLIGMKHYPTYFSQFFVQLMGRTTNRVGEAAKGQFPKKVVNHLIFIKYHVDDF